MLESIHFLDEMVRLHERARLGRPLVRPRGRNGQYEFDFSYTDAVAMADRFMLFRMMAKEVARSHGYEATFMAKPWSDRTGGGAHFNMSLAASDGGENLFAPGDGDDPYGCGISQLGYRFLAGILAHAPAIVAVTCPTVNSYKRLIRRGAMSGSTWAPVFISYGRNNRTHMLRVPTKSPRVESRAVDASVNAYLGAALVLAAGLEGIERELDPGPRSTATCTSQSDEQIAELGVGLLPRTLAEAIDAFEADPLTLEVFGPDLHAAYIDFKRSEWEDFHNTVGQWEWERYLTFYCLARCPARAACRSHRAPSSSARCAPASAALGRVSGRCAPGARGRRPSSPRCRRWRRGPRRCPSGRPAMRTSLQVASSAVSGSTRPRISGGLSSDTGAPRRRAHVEHRDLRPAP